MTYGPLIIFSWHKAITFFQIYFYKEANRMTNKSSIKDRSNSLIAPRNFYGHVLAVAVPIMIQNGITNLVGMLDNLMVGQLSTEAMSGVSIVNQLLFVFYLCIFGGLAGIGIFSAQFWGKKDLKGMQYTMRAKMILAFMITIIGVLVLYIFRTSLIGMFLHEGGDTGDLELTLQHAISYLLVMYAGLLPMAITNVYASTLRETGQTLVPMSAGIIAVFVNLIGNYILIYGKFGAPALGVTGAALATVISRFIEMFIVVSWTHNNPDKNPYIRRCYSSMYIPSDLVFKFIIKGAPLLANEALWSIGTTMLVQCYSVRGLNAVAAFNISNSLANVFNIVFIAMGSATSILLGQELGAGRLDGAKLYALRLTTFSVILSSISGLMLFIIAPVFPDLYNTTDNIKHIALGLLRVNAVCMPLYAFTNSAYFTIRSGGKTFITFLFDSCFCWVVSFPVAFVLSRYTNMPIIWMFLTVQSMDLLKSVIGFIIVMRGKWIHDLTKYAGN